MIPGPTPRRDSKCCRGSRSAAAFPLIGSLVCHYMVIVELLEPTQSAAKGTEGDRERDVAAGSILVLCDFEPFQKTSPSVALALLTGGHII